MAVNWKKTNFLGVRYREHANRKHGVRMDRCFSIRYKLDGKDKEEAAGWGSEGMTAEKAFNLLSIIRENIRTGEGPRTLAEMRQAREFKEELARKERRQKERAALTFSDFWEEQYLPIAKATKSAKSIKTEEGLYKNWIAPAFGNLSLQKLDVRKVEALAVQAQKSGKSARTVCYILSLISLVWNKAVDRGIVEGDSPTRRVKKPRQDNRRMRFLSYEEARQLLGVLRERSMDTHDTALLSLFCGLRAGEIHALTWGDVDLQSGTIQIRDPKNARNRHAFMTEEVKQMLKRRNIGQTKGEYIFPAENQKQRQWISDTFFRTVDALGFNDTGEFTTSENGEQVPVKMSDARQRVVFHTLRHTFASWLVQAGTPLYTVAELMGHTTLEMTRRYSHLAPDSLRKAAMTLQGQLDQKPATVMPFPGTAKGK